MSQLPTIPKFFTNKNVFITGGTGFIGKVLLEKLLRSCPDIKNVYLLIREKKGRSLETRLNELLELPLFDVVRSQTPDALKKIKIVGGDVRELGLGISQSDREVLIHDVNVIFHVAASVRFDDSLKEAVLLNTRGTREVVNLALEATNFDVLVHVSTTFCNTDQQVIGEKMYSPHADWRKTIEIAEKVDKNVLNALTEKYIYPLPNTYTFTKSLAEHVVQDLCQGRIPAVIHRPSVVMPSLKEPFPGWTDSLNGPLAYTAGLGTGMMRIIYGDPDVNVDFVPVDIVVKSIIISAWKQATFKDQNSKLNLNVYNCSNGGVIPLKQKDGLEQCVNETRTVTLLSKVLWYPTLSYTKSFYIFYVKMLFYQLLPAVVIDAILKILGKKPMVMKLQRKIYNSSMALSYFTKHQWNFINHNVLSLEKQLVSSDVNGFKFDTSSIDVPLYNFTMVRGLKKFVLKEDDFEKAKKKLERLRVASFVFNILWYIICFWIVFIEIDVISKICNAERMAWMSLTN